MSLTAFPPAALDECAREFISTFMSNVTRVAADGSTSLTTLARIETLLVDALTDGAGGSSRAWNALYRTIDAIVASGRPANGALRAHAYLRSFVNENGDLAHD